MIIVMAILHSTSEQHCLLCKLPSLPLSDYSPTLFILHWIIRAYKHLTKPLYIIMSPILNQPTFNNIACYTLLPNIITANISLSPNIITTNISSYTYMYHNISVKKDVILHEASQHEHDGRDVSTVQ